MNAEKFEVWALDKKANCLESCNALKEHTAVNKSKQYLNRYGIQFVQIWKVDSYGNATLFGVYTKYLGNIYKLVKC